MPIYWSLLFWTFFAWGLYLISPRVVSFGNHTEKRVSKTNLIIGFFPIIFFAGMKGRGIIDSGGYILSYIKAPSRLSDFDFSWSLKAPGFDLMEVLFKSAFGFHYQYWIFFLALVSSIALMKPLYRYSPMFGFSLFLFIATTQFTWLLNGVRQFLAVTIIFAATNLVINKKFWKYLLVVFVAYTIHNTAIIMLPVYFIARNKLWSKQFGIFLLLFLIISIFIESFAPVANYLLSGTAYENSFSEALSYEGTNISRVLVASLPVILAFFYRKKLEPITTPAMNVIINMAVLNFGVLIISTSVGGNLFGRLSIYFDLYNLIAIPWLLQKCFNLPIRKIVVGIAIIFYILWFYVQMVAVWNLPYNSDTLGIYV